MQGAFDSHLVGFCFFNIHQIRMFYLAPLYNSMVVITSVNRSVHSCKDIDLTPRPYQPEIVPTPPSLLNSDDDDPNIPPFDVNPCAKLLTVLRSKQTNHITNSARSLTLV